MFKNFFKEEKIEKVKRKPIIYRSDIYIEALS